MRFPFPSFASRYYSIGTTVILAPIVLLGFTIICDANAANVVIVDNSRVRCLIIIPREKPKIPVFAAGELQEHIKRASGAMVPITTEGVPAAGSNRSASTIRIYIGRCKATEAEGLDFDSLKTNEGYTQVTKQAIFLAGRDGHGIPWSGETRLPFDDVTERGSLFAVYEFIENNLHAKWLWPGDLGTVLPQATTIAIPIQPLRKITPPFMHTEFRYAHYLSPGTVSDYTRVINPKNLERMRYDTAIWLCRHRFARPPNSFVSRSGHAFTRYWKRFGKSHPEYFALKSDGVRTPATKPELVQMCVSHVGLQKQIIADWLNARKSSPHIWINGNENDRTPRDPACTCSECRTWDGPDPNSHSDRYAKFWLALEALGRKTDPNAYVVGSAYDGYSDPPLKIKLNDHILIRIAPEMDYPFGFYPPERDKNYFRKTWAGWARTGAKLILRPNYFYNGYCMPFIFARAFGKDFKYAASHGMIGTDFDSLTGQWAVQGPNLYMLGRLQEKPHMTVKAVLKEYYDGFGAASRKVRAYFTFWEDITTHTYEDGSFAREHPGINWSNYYRVADYVFKSEYIATGYRLLDAAASLVQGDATLLRRVAFLRQGLRNAELTITVIEERRAYAAHKTPKTQKACCDSILALDKYRKEISNGNAINPVFLLSLENRVFGDRNRSRPGEE